MLFILTLGMFSLLHDILDLMEFSCVLLLLVNEDLTECLNSKCVTVASLFILVLQRHALFSNPPAHW